MPLDLRQPTTVCLNSKGALDELTERTPLDIDAMPIFVKKELAAAAWSDLLGFMQRPDAQSILNAEREILQREGSPLLSSAIKT